MLWKFFGLQKLFDSLFDERWLSLGMASNQGTGYEAPPALPRG